MKVTSLIRGSRPWKPVDMRGFTDSKFGRILDLCKDKDVLDCGCVGSPLEQPVDLSGTSHYHIASAAKTCVGVDIVAAEVEKRQRAGYDVRVANVETMTLGQTFDVVVAADLIEHLANPGAFLERVRDHLRPGGYLCLVTPNPWSANAVFKALFGVQMAVNQEHTSWFDPTTIEQLLERYGFMAVEWYWQDYRKQPLAALIVRIRPNLSAHFIVIARLSARKSK